MPVGYILLYIKINSLDIGSWNVSNVASMMHMFSFVQIDSLDLSSWDVSSVTNMSYMFSNSKIQFSLDLHSWELLKATSLVSMFMNAEIYNSKHKTVEQVTEVKALLYDITNSIRSLENIIYSDVKELLNVKV